MARTKRGVISRARHKKVLKAVKGQYGRRKNTLETNVSLCQICRKVYISLHYLAPKNLHAMLKLHISFNSHNTMVYIFQS